MTDYSNPFEIQTESPKSPIAKYITWQGTEGYWKHREKQDGDSYKNVSLGENIFIVPMVIFNCVTGWNSAVEASVRSNEVLHLNKDLVVRLGSSEIARGKWSSIKEAVTSAKGDFTVRIYGMMMAKGKASEMVVLDLSRSSLSSWIDSKPRPSTGELLKLGKNPEVQKNGVVSYFVPTIDNKGAKEETKASAMELWPPVAKYLNDRELYYAQVEEEKTAVQQEEPTAPTVAPAMDLGASTLNAPSPSKAPEQDNELDDLPF